MILCDAGPLIALIDSDDPHHRKCVAALVSLPAEPMLTTWPCLAEAMYILGREGGLPVQDELWEYLADGTLRLHLPEPDEWQRMRALMRQYHDSPMDLADASLVAAAEGTSVRKLFSLDQHFRAYRIHGTEAFEIVP
jgi:predicted nucleic acid-binding protein